MRFLKLFFSVVVGISLIVAGLGWVFTEGQIRLGATVFESELEKITRLAAKPREEDFEWCTGKKTKEITEKASTANYPIKSYRLRFTNTKEFTIEMLCRNNALEIAQISTGSLPYSLEKSGGSGIEVPVELKDFAEVKAKLNGFVELATRFKKVRVGYFDGKLETRTMDKNDESVNFGNSTPVTTCEGWGSLCCSPISEVGEGSLQNGVTDCSGECYKVCGQRPVLAFFNTQPLMDRETRVVRLTGPNPDVVYGWEITDSDNRVVKVRLDFGDGSYFEAEEPEGTTTHEYNCASRPCRFETVIEAVDEKGYGLGEIRFKRVSVLVE